MATATYHAGKIYLPKRIREELGLTDGDRMEIASRDGKIIASPLKEEDPDNLLISPLNEQLERKKASRTPVSPPWRRRDIYNMLASPRAEGESFTDVIKRAAAGLKEKPLSSFAGAWAGNEEELDGILSKLEAMWTSHDGTDFSC